MEKTQEYWEDRPEVYQMQYGDFAKEYDECMAIAREKESKGNLDPYSPGYVPMTDEEVSLHERDWRAFSRLRGFSEYDIAEYARWHKLSGQTDNLEYARNDPWRRPLPGWESLLYIKHIQRAIGLEISISPEVMVAYEMVKKELEDSKPIERNIDQNQSPFSEMFNVPLATDLWEDEDVWEEPKTM